MRGRSLGLSLAVLEAALAAALAVTVMGCGGTGESAKKSEEPIKIGAVLSLTGTYAPLGTAEEKALRLEEKRINDAGGIDGRKIKILIEDDTTDQSKAVVAATRLIDSDKVVAIIGASGTGQSMAIRGNVQAAGIAQISMAGGMVITDDFDSHVFQTPWSNRIVVPFVLDAIKESGAKKIALLSDSSMYGKDGRGLILTEAKSRGISIVEDLTFNPGDTDLGAQLTTIKSSDAEAVLLWTAGKEGAIAVKGAKDLGMDLPWYGGSGQARMQFITGAGDAAEGFVFGTGKSLVPSTWGTDSKAYDVNTSFAKRFEAEYGEKPDIFAGHAFDAMLLIEDALKRAGSDDPKDVLAALEKTDEVIGFDGTFTFSKKDHNGLTEKALALYRVENGTWVPVEK